MKGSDLVTAEEILKLTRKTIEDWHEKNSDRPVDAQIVTDNIRRIRPLGEHRDDLEEVVQELVWTNTDMWHEQDKMRSADPKTVLIGIDNTSPLNQHRNDLIEEVDEIIADSAPKSESLTEQILDMIQKTIVEWHEDELTRGDDYVIATEEVVTRRKMGDHRDEVLPVVRDLVWMHCEGWHEEDKVREKRPDDEMVRIVRNMNPINTHRNDLVEEIDEIIEDMAKEVK